MSIPGAAIDVCVPVYNAAAFIEETLDSILSMDFKDFRLLISVDKCTDASAAICETYTDERRVRIFKQSERLGFVGNCNFLMRQVTAPMMKFSPHDDLLPPVLLGQLHDFIVDHPDCAAAIPLVDGFGEKSMRFDQAEVRGPVLRRLLDIIMNQRSVAAFHGLVRVHANPEMRPMLPAGFLRDFEVDVPWMAQVALDGELRRVKDAVVHKRFSPSMKSQQWIPRAINEFRQLQVQHTAQLTKLAFMACESDEQRDQVIMAALVRLHGRGFYHGVESRALHRRLFKNQFAKAFREALDGESAQHFDRRGIRALNRKMKQDQGVVGATLLAVQARRAARNGNSHQALAFYQKALQMDPYAGWVNELKQAIGL